MKLLIGTRNPVKIEAAKQAFENYFSEVETEGISVDSEVGDQPSDRQITVGAKNRIKNLKLYAKQNNIYADFFVAVEGGATNLLGDWIVLNIAVVESKDGIQSMGTSQGFPVPERYIEEAKQSEFSKVMDKVFDLKHVGKDLNEISVESIITRNEATRTGLIKNAVIVALTKHINGEIWQ